MGKPDWTCGTCTLLNSARKRRCQVCNSRRPVVEVKKAKRTVSKHDVGENNDAADSKSPRFELSSTKRTAIVVTTAANKENSNSNRNKILANGLVAAIGSINGRCQTITAPIESVATASRKRPRPSTHTTPPQRAVSPPSPELQLTENTKPDSGDSSVDVPEEKMPQELDSKPSSELTSDHEQHISSPQSENSRKPSRGIGPEATPKAAETLIDLTPVPVERTIPCNSNENERIEATTIEKVETPHIENQPKETEIKHQNTNPDQISKIQNNICTKVEKTAEMIEIENAHPFSKTSSAASTMNAKKCNDNTTDLYGTVEVETSVKETSIIPTNVSPVNIDTRQLCATNEQSGPANSGGQLSHATPCKKNDKEENLSQGQSDFESQSSFLNAHSSCFAYTPLTASQTSIRESPHESTEIEENLPAPSRLQDSPLREQPTVSEPQSERKVGSSNSCNKNSSSLPGSSHPRSTESATTNSPVHNGVSPVAFTERKETASTVHHKRQQFPESSSATTSTAKSFSAMFQTAGSGSSIAVSEDQVKAMGRILDRPSPSKKQPTQKITSTKALTGMFQTAGSGSSITVSKEKVQEMGRILNRPSKSNKASTKPLTAPKKKTFTGIFQTAGSGSSITVSEEKVQEMGRILNRPSKLNKQSIKPAEIASKKDFTGMFQTAGSGTSIAVSEEKVKEMGRILNKPSLSKTAPAESFRTANKSTFTGMFQTAGSGTSIAVSEEKVKEAGQMLNRSSTSNNAPIGPSKTTNKSAFTGMFQTAGRGSSIVVSEEKVKEMGTMLNRPSSSSKEPNQSLKMTTATKTPFKAMFQTAGRGSSIVVSEEKVKEMGRILDRPSSSKATLPLETTNSAKTPFTGMFQTAGSGSSIMVSEEKVKEMGKILERPSSANRESIVPLKRPSAVLSDKTTTAKKPRRIDFAKEGLMATRTPMASFQTPRSVTIAKNESSLPSSMFQTAGTGKTIEVSEDKIEEMGLLMVKPSTLNQTVEGKTRNSQKFVTVTDVADKKHRPRSPTNPDHRFVEANLRLYPHSPLRSNDIKSTKCNPGPVACTPLQEIEATPNNQFVGRRSLARIAYGVTPSSVPNVGDSHPVSTSKNDLNQLQSLSENQELDSETPKEESNPGESFENSSLCQSLKDAIHRGVMSHCPSICHLHGVRETTILVNCVNSLQLRFDLDGYPHRMVHSGADESQCPNTLGSLSDIRQSMIDKGCDPSRINDKWIRNHTRWIIWKLASYERRFSRFLGGKYMTYHNLVDNLLRRFQKEILNGTRPALRKVVNRDAAASKMMILVVCQVLSSSKANSDDSSPQSTVIELSDGWYSVKGCLDSKLSQFVDEGLITVGTKLLVSSARLVGAEDGVDPLDEGDGSGCQNCKVTLQLTANATRLARWNAKLGFVKNLNNKEMPHGHLLVKRISDIVAGGGNIPAMRLFIQRVYPILYYEKSEPSDPGTANTLSNNVKRRVFTTQEEDTRRREFEARKLRVVEALTDRLQREVEQEVDESAPESWKRMMSSTTPEDIYESMTDDEKSEISKWKEKRSSSINRRVREEVESELEVETSLVRESTSFLRVKVHSIHPKSSVNESAILTIWQPTEEQLAFLNEGTAVEIHNLAVRHSAYDGVPQLVANSRTIIERFEFEASSLAKTIGFRHRRFLNIFSVHKLSHQVSNEKGGKISNENFDTAAVQIHVQTTNVEDDFTFYLSDETNLILRVHCRNPPSALKTFLLSKRQSFPTYAMRDLIIRPFDDEEQCAVAEFSEVSSVVSTNDRLENLSKWVASSEFEVQQIAAYVEAGLPLWESDCIKKIYLGYVIGFRCESIEKLYIEVDCCGQGAFEWKVPFAILEQMVSTISSVNLQKCSSIQDSELSSVFRSKSVLWRFQVVSEPDVVVYSATKAEKRAIGQLYKTLQQFS